MRWIFYSLLVINLVYVGFQLTKSLAPEPPSLRLPVSQAAAGGERLRLLADSPQPQSVPAASVPGCGWSPTSIFATVTRW